MEQVTIGERRQDEHGRSQWPVLRDDVEVGTITSARAVRHLYTVSRPELGHCRGYAVCFPDFDGHGMLFFETLIQNHENHNTVLARAKEAARRLAWAK